MDNLRDEYASGRQEAIHAFADLTALARRAGVDHDTISALHGRFFDALAVQRNAFVVTLLLAEIL